MAKNQNNNTVAPATKKTEPEAKKDALATPRARSRPRLPVEMASTCMEALSPSFITAPLPNCFSIWARAPS